METKDGDLARANRFWPRIVDVMRELVMPNAHPSRRHPRAPFAGTVAMWQQRQPHLVPARNLSANGLYLITDVDLGEGSLLTLRLSLPGQRGMTVLSRVVRTQRGRAPLLSAGLAVEFIDIDPRDRARLAGYVERSAPPQLAAG